MSAFERAFHEVVEIEGGYSNDARDSGGKTKFGITEAVARDNGYFGDMRDLTIEDARAIYKAQYWDLVKLDEVAALSVPVALELFDTSVNCGAGVAGRFLQSALNAFNLGGTIYPDAKVDGLVGPRTVANLRAFMGKRGKAGELVLLRALNSLQGARYVELALTREKDEAFVFGWILNRVKMDCDGGRA